MDYGKSQLWSWWVGSVSYVNKWAYGSTLGAYVKWNIDYSMSMLSNVLWAFQAKIRSLKREINVYELY